MTLESTKNIHKGIIKNVEKIAFNTYAIEFFSNLNRVFPGQFISIYCPNTVLRRPFSVMDFDENKNTLKIIFKLKGEGTDYLRNLKEGSNIDFLAPLGNGFNIKKQKALLVGAGVGIAPILFLRKVLNERNIENYFISGFKTEQEVIKGADKTFVGGSVLDEIENIIKENNIEIIYSCAPMIVLRKLSEIANRLSIPVQIALEKVMACSIGVCRGCIIKISKDNDIVNASVCKDGPVFLGSEVVWD